MKISIFSLVGTVFLLWLTIQINSIYEDYLAYFFILTVGILHGANDISLINFLTKKSDASNKKFLMLYICIIGFMSLAFYQFAFPALMLFILFSCYHFGEQHFYSQIKTPNNLTTLLYIHYGILIFGLLFYFNLEDTTQIIYELTNVQLNDNYFSIFLLIGLIGTPLLTSLSHKKFSNRINYIQELFLILLFTLLFKMASLLWAFAIYFILWHSIPSLKDQIETLYGNLDRKNLISYFKSSSLNWIISISGLILIYYLTTIIEVRFVTLFFAFLAAITIPHVIVMYFLNKK